MPVSLYMDVHVPEAITVQIRLRGVDVLTAIEDGTRRVEDSDLLERAMRLGRILFTQDIRFKALAEDWQAIERAFAGMIYADQRGPTIGDLVRDLTLIAQVTEPSEKTQRK